MKKCIRLNSKQIIHKETVSKISMATNDTELEITKKF